MSVLRTVPGDRAPSDPGGCGAHEPGIIDPRFTTQAAPEVEVAVKSCSPGDLTYLACHRSQSELAPAVPVDRVQAMAQEKPTDPAEETPSSLRPLSISSYRSVAMAVAEAEATT